MAETFSLLDLIPAVTGVLVLHEERRRHQAFNKSCNNPNSSQVVRKGNQVEVFHNEISPEMRFSFNMLAVFNMNFLAYFYCKG